MPDILLYILLALIVCYLALVGACFYRKKHRKSRKQPSKKRPVVKTRSPYRQFSDERYRLNLMAMEAARQMAISASKSSKTVK